MFTLLLTAVSSAIYAGTCELNVSRTACPQKEEFSYRKCDGRASCTATIPQTTAEQCLQLALRACANPYPLITKNKQITAKFDDQVLRADSEQSDICQAYSHRQREFDKC
jgi:hypothetical protein